MKKVFRLNIKDIKKINYLELLNYNNKALLIVLLIFALAAVLRSQEWISGNYLFLIDQGRDMMAVKNIVFGHHLTLIGPYTSLQGVFQGPLWYYLLAVPILITKGNPIGPQFLMFIISMLVALTVYFCMKHFFDKRTAIFATFLFAISPEAIAASTYIWNPHPMWLLIVLYIFCFYQVVLKKNKFQILLWPLIGIMFNFEAAMAIFILIASVIYFILFARKQIKSKYFITGMLIFLITFLPQIVFELRHNFLMTRSVLSLFDGHNQGLFVKGEDHGYADLMISHIQAYYNNFLSGFIALKVFPSLSNILLIIFLAIGFFHKKLEKIFSDKEKCFIGLIFKLVVIIITLSFLYPFPIRYWFLTGFQSFYILFIALVLSKLWRNVYFKTLILIFLVLICIQTAGRVNEIYSSKDYGGAAKIKGKIDALDYIYKDAHGKPFGLLVFTPPVYTYAYDYLIWWHGEREYRYIPYKDKRGTFYLLIEPDPSKPWSYKGWLQTVIRTGKIESAVKLKSGFIIQKRIGS